MPVTCPDHRDLVQLLTGELSDGDSQKLDEHLLRCSDCCAALERLQPQDAVFQALRSAGTEDLRVSETIQHVMARLASQAPPTATIEETVAPQSQPSKDPWNPDQLLDPAEAPDELGRFGGYRVLRVLGAGGMGIVLEGEDPKLRRRVALKVMKGPLAQTDEYQQRFLREARAAAAIEHSHIVTVYQVGEQRGMPFLAMQLLKGESLEERLQREPQLPLAECLRIGREVAEALGEAHSRGLVHRDIKPANIWLEGSSGWVKLVDFGLARASEDIELTQSGAIMGTPAYMSPEQACSDGVDGRTDLYSLGAVLYRLTTGEVPFRGSNTMAVLMALGTEEPTPPRQKNPEIPTALNDLILRLLAKRPENRFPSAQAVVDVIAALEAKRHEPRPIVVAPRLNQQTRRLVWISAALAACLILAAAVIIIRKKHGHEVARVQVPDKRSVEAIPEKNLIAARQANKIIPSAASASSSPATRAILPMSLDEPPPLDEWLKGRSILTVAQDGSGQFKTIQAAIDALQPGQVVQVLDKGPYRERLEFSPPDDSGLISTVVTEVQLSDWRVLKTGEETMRLGHLIASPNGFRISGFDWSNSESYDYSRVCFNVPNPCGVVIENCRFTGSGSSIRFGGSVGAADVRGARPNFLRENGIESNAIFAASMGPPATIVALRNVFRFENPEAGTWMPQISVISGDPVALKAVVFRHNLFAGGVDCDLFVWGQSTLKHFDVCDNTFFSGTAVLVKPGFGGMIRAQNNLHVQSGMLALAEQIMRESEQRWDIGHNAYPRESRVGFARAASDVVAPVSFLSHDRDNANFARLATDDPLGKAGAGGDLPSYVGALPPGPCPKEGDWFSRLLERSLGRELAPASSEN